MLLKIALSILSLSTFLGIGLASEGGLAEAEKSKLSLIEEKLFQTLIRDGFVA